MEQYGNRENADKPHIKVVMKRVAILNGDQCIIFHIMEESNHCGIC